MVVENPSITPAAKMSSEPVLSISRRTVLFADLQVYVHYNELANFFRALSSLLCLPGDAGPGTAVAAISNLLQQADR